MVQNAVRPPARVSIPLERCQKTKPTFETTRQEDGSATLRSTQSDRPPLRFQSSLNCPNVFPESVWAQGSSNSGGLYLIFSSSHLLIFTPAHLHTCSSSHLLIFTSSHLHICSSSHLLIFTSAHLHICSSSRLVIFTSAHLHVLSSSHLLIFTPAHLHTCSSSHLLIFTSVHLHICSSSHLLILLIFTPAHLHICSHLLIFTPAHLHTCSSSHLLIFTSAHLHICSSSHLLIFTSAHLHICLFSLPFLSLAFFIFFSLGRGWYRRRVTKRQPFCTKWGSISKNWGKIAILLVLEQPFRTKWGSIGKNWSKIASLLVPEQPFHTKWGSIGKNWGKIASLLVPEQPFHTKWGSIAKNWGKITIFLVPDLSRSNPFARNEGRSPKTEVKLRFFLCRTCPGATLSHEMRVDGQKLRKNCDFSCAGLVLEQPLRTKWWSMVKNGGKFAILLAPDLSWSNPFARNEGRSSKTEEKLGCNWCWM